MSLYYRTLIKYTPLLLDLYPNASIAYSLRKLRSAYSGSAIRVRRSSDNTEQDIGFIDGEIDTVSLLSFVGANNGFVTVWYDQSGNGNNATQGTALEQPQIVAGGVVNNLICGKPCVVTLPSRMNMTNSITSVQELSMFSVYEGRVPSQISFFIGNLSSNLYLYSIGGGGNYITNINGSAAFNFQTITSVNNRILSLFRNSGNGMRSFQQKTIMTNVTNRSGNSTYNTILGSSILGYGKYSEIIWWNGQDLISNQANISDKINEYYGIY